MSYLVFSYAIDANEVRAALGSGNQALYDAVLENEQLQGYMDGEDLDGLPVADALQQLIFGGHYDAKYAHQYWYAFISLCDYLKKNDDERLLELDMAYGTDRIDATLASRFDIQLNSNDLLLNKSDFFGLPATTDFPVYGLLLHPALQSLQEKLEPVDITMDVVDALEVGAARDKSMQVKADGHYFTLQLKEAIEECVENSWDLVTFCH